MLFRKRIFRNRERKRQLIVWISILKIFGTKDRCRWKANPQWSGKNHVTEHEGYWKEKRYSYCYCWQCYILDCESRYGLLYDCLYASFNLPQTIAEPIRQLTSSIRQIAGRNYHERVHFKGSEEFNDLADSFNIMAEKLEEYESSNLSKQLMDKNVLKHLSTICTMLLLVWMKTTSSTWSTIRLWE